MRSRQRHLFESINNLYFVTSTIVGFINVFNDDLYNIFVDDLSYYQKRGDFVILCYVLMPNHFHLIIKTSTKCNVSSCVANIKRISSRHISSYLAKNNGGGLLQLLKNKASEEPSPDSKIWKPRFDCMVIIKEDILKQKIGYCHYNPVRAGLVKEPTDWPYSSSRNYTGFSEVPMAVDNSWKCLGF